jgi:hypothetical protein
MPIHVFLSASAYLKGGYYAFKFLKNDVKLFIEAASLETAWVKFLT